MEDVREGRTIPVPKHLKDTHYKGSKRLGHGKNYKYAHDFPEGFVEQDYLGIDITYYEPSVRGFEKELSRRLHELKQRRADNGEGGEKQQSPPASQQGAEPS
jgi:putative ATPase